MDHKRYMADCKEEQGICQRCGQCCLKGGPVLMAQDAALLQKGVLAPDDLLCLRKGEWVHDNVRNRLVQQEVERIKIKGSGDTQHPWRCRHYLDDPVPGCAIYQERPAQCAALFCRKPDVLKKLLQEEAPLCRFEALDALGQQRNPSGAGKMLASNPALWKELIAAHEEQNPVGPVLHMASLLGFTADKSREREENTRPESRLQKNILRHITEAVRTDMAFRTLCSQRTALPDILLPFLLGRPLVELLAELGLRPVDRKGLGTYS